MSSRIFESHNKNPYVRETVTHVSKPKRKKKKKKWLPPAWTLINFDGTNEIKGPTCNYDEIGNFKFSTLSPLL